MNRKKERFLWASLLAVSLTFHFFRSAEVYAGAVDDSHKYQQILQNLIFYMKNLYVEPLDEKRLITGAIRGLLASSGDPFTRFLDREEFAEFNDAQEGTRVGIGVEVAFRDNYPTIIAPVPGGPAEKAGIKAGDRILAIDRKSVEKLPFGEMLKLIGGESGSIIEMDVLRDGIADPIRVRITRGVFALEYCTGLFLDEGRIGYIRLTQFFGEDQGSIEKFRAYIDDFKNKKVKGMIVDLRNNTGGHVDMAVRLAGYFLKPDQVVVIARGRSEELSQTYTAGRDAGFAGDLPLVILINQGSASASEIMAGALQDHGRAKLIGSRSFGKGSVQQIVGNLPDDTAALITYQKYFTPANRSIHGVGLTPDLPVEDIKPTADENYFLFKMQEASFLREFHQANPQYTPGIRAAFDAETTKRGWKLSPLLSLFLLKREYAQFRSGEPDLETDPQLQRAIAELNH